MDSASFVQMFSSFEADRHPADIQQVHTVQLYNSAADRKLVSIEGRYYPFAQPDKQIRLEHCLIKMGSFQSREQGSEVDSKVVKRPKRVQRKVNIERLPVVEEVFVKEVAYKCGITKDEVDNKRVEYLQNVKKNPERGLEDFTNLHRDLKRNRATRKKQITEVFR